MDIALIITFSIMLFRRCKSAGVSSVLHIVKFAGYWVLSESLGMLIFMQLGYSPFTLLASLSSLLMGAGAGYLSYKKSVSDIAKHIQNDTPQLPQ